MEKEDINKLRHSVKHRRSIGEKFYLITVLSLIPLTIWAILYFGWESIGWWYDDWFCIDSVINFGCDLGRYRDGNYISMQETLLGWLAYILVPLLIGGGGIWVNNKSFGSIANKIIKIIEPDLTVINNKSITEKMVFVSSLYLRLSKIKGKNYTYGKINGVDVEFSNVKLYPSGSTTMFYSFKLPEKYEEAFHFNIYKKEIELEGYEVEYYEVEEKIKNLVSLMDGFVSAVDDNEQILKDLKARFEVLKIEKISRDKQMEDIKNMEKTKYPEVINIFKENSLIEDKYMTKKMIDYIISQYNGSNIVRAIYKGDRLYISAHGTHENYLSPNWYMDDCYIQDQEDVIDFVRNIAEEISKVS
jgi:hypothetical protein